MAKYLKVGSTGLPTEESSVSTSAGAGDAGKIPELDGAGKLSSTMMPAGLGQDSKTVTAGEALSAGNLVYLNGSGQALKADANAVAKAAIGYVLASAASSASVVVYFEGTVSGLSSLTPGAQYFLSDSATGGITTSVPTGSNKIVQPVGWATSATELSFSPGTPIVRV